jgi:type I restriction enzyme S subunit
MAGKTALSGRYEAYPEYKDSGIDWIGNMPAHWILLKGGYIGQLFGSESIPEDQVLDEGVLPFIKVSDLELDGFSSKAFSWFVSENKAKSCRPAKNYIVFPKRGAAIFTNKVNVIAVESVIDPNLMGWKISDIAVTAYIAHLIKTRGLEELADVSTVPQINNKHIVPEKFPIPPVEEQQIIANFLDHETAKIDSLIDKQQQLIILLKEKRQAVISHAVTKGLNPEAPMRDSGVEWLGEVPAHWERKSLNYLIAHTVDNRGRTPPVIDEGIPMVEVSQVAGNGFYTSDNYNKFITQESYDQFVRSDVKENDILFVTVGATFGKTCLVPSSPGFFIAQNVVGFRCIDDVDSKFFMFLLSSSVFKEAISATNKASTIDNVKVSDLVRTRLVIPPHNEQIEIANYIFTIVERYEKLVAKAESVIGLIKERRTALISAAVTGKIDVRNWQAPVASNNNKEVNP